LKKQKKCWWKNGNIELKDYFEHFICAINVLKHGQGKSYNQLLSKSESLPFKIKLPGQNFFHEADVSEILTLIQVDDEFVLNCAEVIKRVSEEIRKENSH
jgi:hypothetical protein